MNVELPDAASTAALGSALARALPAVSAGWTLLLDGELGSGKTTLARALLRALGYDGPVPSPTYTLVEPYELPGGRRVYHVDLYRIGGEDELAFLGWDELDDGLKLIEWPQRAPGVQAAADVRVRLAYDGTGRRAEIECLSRRAAGAFAEGLRGSSLRQRRPGGSTGFIN